jgi:hypothetical protein
VTLASGLSTAPTSKQERAWVDLAPACRQKQGAGPAGIQGNPRGHDIALPAPAYAQMGAPEYRSGAHLLRTTRQRLTQRPPNACPLRRAGMSVEPCSSTVCGRRACRSSRGPCGDAGNNPCRRHGDQVVAPAGVCISSRLPANPCESGSRSVISRRPRRGLARRRAWTTRREPRHQARLGASGQDWCAPRSVYTR